jgi:hypothetical protein
MWLKKRVLSEMKLLHFFAFLTISYASPVGVGKTQVEVATKEVANALLDTLPVRRPRSASIHSFDELFPYRNSVIMSGTLESPPKGKAERYLPNSLKRKLIASNSIPEEVLSEPLKKPRFDYHVPNPLANADYSPVTDSIKAKEAVQPSFFDGNAHFDGISGEYPPSIVTKTQRYVYDKRKAEGLDVTTPEIVEKMRLKANAHDINIHNKRGRETIGDTGIRKPVDSQFEKAIDKHSAARNERLDLQSRMLGREFTPKELSKINRAAYLQHNAVTSEEYQKAMIAIIKSHEKISGEKLTLNDQLKLMVAIKNEFKESKMMRFARMKEFPGLEQELAADQAERQMRRLE